MSKNQTVALASQIPRRLSTSRLDQPQSFGVVHVVQSTVHAQNDRRTFLREARAKRNVRRERLARLVSRREPQRRGDRATGGDAAGT